MAVLASRRSHPARAAALAFALTACGSDAGDPVGDTGAADAADVSADAQADTSADSGTDGDAAVDDTGAGACAPSAERCDGLTSDPPPRLSEHGAAYVDELREMVVFGGTTGVPENCDPAVASEYVDTTWVYDDVCGVWATADGAGPSARGRHAMAAGGGKVWMFGGRYRDEGRTSGNYDLFDDLWSFDPATQTWTDTGATGPSARMNAAIVWDSTRDRLILFGGNASASGATTTPLNDVWAYDPADNAWTQLAPGAGPTPRLAVGATYDATRDVVAIYGGFDTLAFTGAVSYFRELWTLSFSGDTGASWELSSRNSGPDGRFGSAIVHDTVSDTYVVFGGHDDQALGNRNDAWIFAPGGNIWGRLTLGDQQQAEQLGFCDFPPDFTTIDPNLPERRHYHTLVWSEACGHAVLFGGKTDCGAINDVWTYADEQWTEVVTATSGESCERFQSNPDNCANLCF